MLTTLLILPTSFPSRVKMMVGTMRTTIRVEMSCIGQISLQIMSGDVLHMTNIFYKMMSGDSLHMTISLQNHEWTCPAYDKYHYKLCARSFQWQNIVSTLLKCLHGCKAWQKPEYP